MTQRALIPFLLVSFGIAWGIIALYIFASDMMVSTFGALSGQHALFYLAVYSPAIAAFMVILYADGRAGVRRFLPRLLLWRVSWGWYGFIILGIPAVYYSAALMQGQSLSHPFPFASVAAYLAAAFSWRSRGRLRKSAGAAWLCRCCSVGWPRRGLVWLLA